MRLRFYSIVALVSLATFFQSCSKQDNVIDNTYKAITVSQDIPATGFPEGFEAGTKGAYAAADVTFSSGVWNLNDALVGTSTSDVKTGLKSIRMQNTGKATMMFNTTTGASTVTISHAKYGTDASSTWDLYMSTNSGSTWTKVGSTVTTSTTTLVGQQFTVDVSGNIRFEIRKLTGGSARINIDDFAIEQYAVSGPTRDNNLGMGNPSNAVTDVNVFDNYLMVKTQYVLSYNRTKATCNWVSWHLSTAWKGTTPRQDNFSTDAMLPTGWYKVATSHYTNSGFDRGHMCPSDDRDGSVADNSETFKMTNIVPQAPINNQQTWAALETYCRTLMSAGNELYITSGVQGVGGTGSLGGVTNTINNGLITVPAFVWKVIVVLPTGTNDASRVSTSTRVIAVKMPNNQTVNQNNWGFYRCSVDELETLLGYDFLSTVSTSVQNVVEVTVDNGPIN